MAGQKDNPHGTKKRSHESDVTDRLSQFLFFISLTLLGGNAYADKCRCKLPYDNLFQVTACPANIASSPVAPAILPSMSYRSIAIEDFMSLVGRLAGISVCLSNETRGHIQWQSTQLEPWPVVVEVIVQTYGLGATIADKSVYLYGKLK